MGDIRVDLHTHTRHSRDATLDPAELVARARDAGLDRIAVTDHNRIEGALEAAAFDPSLVIIGEELDCDDGSHLIGLFLTDFIPPGLSVEETAGRIREQGGIVYLPHPFDPMRSCLRPDVIDDLVGRGLVDAMEARNGKTSLEHLNRQAAEYAAEHGLAAGGGSDAHVPEALGAVYAEMDDFDDAASFLASLHRARVVGHHFDAPRRWRPRIVPSVKTI
jgi:predicted metal-dependent phosphoesterase TrpH